MVGFDGAQILPMLAVSFGVSISIFFMNMDLHFKYFESDTHYQILI